MKNTVIYSNVLAFGLVNKLYSLAKFTGIPKGLYLIYQEKAAEGYSPATMDEAARPSFIDISEHSWIWGYDMTPDIAMFNPYATSSAWIRSFSGDGYSAGTQVYACINKILYDKIPETDIRKGWWVDENLESPLLATVTWNGVSGNAVAPLEIDNVKMPFLPYTNVKFGMYNVGGTNNDEDWPYMRVEEMILIQAEGLVKSGAPEEGRRIRLRSGSLARRCRTQVYR